MLGFVGIRKDRPDMADPESYIRELRRGKRLERLGKKVDRRPGFA
jgi:hypothetical protein